MRVLFVISDIFLGEPIGVLQLSAIVKAEGHQSRLLPLRQQALAAALDREEPDLVAYSTMSPETALFAAADEVVRAWGGRRGRRPLRVMGGPHPTFFPEILEELDLDAICVGEGDRALPALLRRAEGGEGLEGIPNLIPRGGSLAGMQRELIQDLDRLPFLDKAAYFEAMPAYRSLALRSFMSSRGCPYDCTYCYNHAARALFRGCGPLVRRQSVSRVLAEVRQVIERYPPVRFVKFSDDTFAHRVDDWIREFAERYPQEIGLPFYCLMRSNTLTEEMAALLRGAGCRSIGMSVESGDERVRNEVLRRGLTDAVVIRSFALARRHGIKTYGNTLLAIPGTTLEDDLASFRFTRRLRMTVPTFGIFNPYPKTALAEYAVRLGVLDPGHGLDHQYGLMTPLTSYTPAEKRQQLSLMYLGTLFCDLPDACLPLLRWLLRLGAVRLYKYVGTLYMVLKTGWHIFPGVYPRNPLRLLRLLWDSVKFFVPGRGLRRLKAAPGGTPPPGSAGARSLP